MCIIFVQPAVVDLDGICEQARQIFFYELGLLPVRCVKLEKNILRLLTLASLHVHFEPEQANSYLQLVESSLTVVLCKMSFFFSNQFNYVLHQYTFSYQIYTQSHRSQTK